MKISIIVVIVPVQGYLPIPEIYIPKSSLKWQLVLLDSSTFALLYIEVMFWQCLSNRMQQSLYCFCPMGSIVVLVAVITCITHVIRFHCHMSCWSAGLIVCYQVTYLGNDSKSSRFSKLSIFFFLCMKPMQRSSSTRGGQFRGRVWKCIRASGGVKHSQQQGWAHSGNPMIYLN